jgi:hypothetical protein
MSLEEKEVQDIIKGKGVDEGRFKAFLATLSVSQPEPQVQAPPAEAAPIPAKDETAFEALISKLSANAPNIAAQTALEKPAVAAPKTTTTIDTSKFGLAKQEQSGIRGAEVIIDDVSLGSKRGVLFFGAGFSGNYHEAKVAAGYRLKNLPAGFDAGVISEASYSLTKQAFHPPTLTAAVGYSDNIKTPGVDLKYRVNVETAFGKGTGGIEPTLGVRVETGNTWKLGEVRDIKPYAEGHYNPFRSEGDIKTGISAKTDFRDAAISVNTGLKTQFGHDDGPKVSPYVGVGLKYTF